MRMGNKAEIEHLGGRGGSKEEGGKGERQRGGEHNKRGRKVGHGSGLFCKGDRDPPTHTPFAATFYRAERNTHI